MFRQALIYNVPFPGHTYVHIYNHTIAFMTTNSGSHNDQSVLGDEVPYTSFRLLVMVWVGVQIELQSFSAYK